MMRDLTSLNKTLKTASLNAILEEVQALVKMNPQDLKLVECCLSSIASMDAGTRRYYNCKL